MIVCTYANKPSLEFVVFCEQFWEKRECEKNAQNIKVELPLQDSELSFLEGG